MEWKFFPHDVLAIEGSKTPKKPGDEFAVVAFGATRWFVATEVTNGMFFAEPKKEAK